MASTVRYKYVSRHSSRILQGVTTAVLSPKWWSGRGVVRILVVSYNVVVWMIYLYQWIVHSPVSSSFHLDLPVIMHSPVVLRPVGLYMLLCLPLCNLTDIIQSPSLRMRAAPGAAQLLIPPLDQS